VNHEELPKRRFRRKRKIRSTSINFKRVWVLSAACLATALISLILGVSGNSALAFTSTTGGGVTPEPSSLALLLITGAIFRYAFVRDDEN